MPRVSALAAALTLLSFFIGGDCFAPRAADTEPDVTAEAVTLHDDNNSGSIEDELREALSSAAKKTPVKIVLTQDVALTNGQLSIDAGKIIMLTSETGNQYKITAAAGENKRVIELVKGNSALAPGGSLTLENIVLTGGNLYNNAADDYMESGGGGVLVDEYASLIMNANSCVSGNQALLGGGVHVRAGSLTMRDNAVIKDNKAVDGGGVYLTGDYPDGGGEIIMNDKAVVSGNSAKTAGGGVFVTLGGVLEMNNSAEIKSNSASGASDDFGGGGGVYLSDGALTMNNNATVFDNKASANGGGVNVIYGALTINDSASVSCNTAVAGGGVYIYDYWGWGIAMSMSGTPSITDNTAHGDGGGVYLHHGDDGYDCFYTLDVSGVAAVKKNSAGGDGGGIYIGAYEDLSIDGDGSLAFSGNTAGRLYKLKSGEPGTSAIPVFNGIQITSVSPDWITEVNRATDENYAANALSVFNNYDINYAGGEDDFIPICVVRYVYPGGEAPPDERIPMNKTGETPYTAASPSGSAARLYWTVSATGCSASANSVAPGGVLYITAGDSSGPSVTLSAAYYPPPGDLDRPNPQEPTEPTEPPEDAETPEDTEIPEDAGTDETPEMPGEQPGTIFPVNPIAPPLPTNPGAALVPSIRDDGEEIILEIAEDGTPLGEWRYEPERGEWRYQPYDTVPSAIVPPETYDRGVVLWVFAAMAALTLAVVAAAPRKRPL
jgi:hypothetical protein